MCYPSYEQLSGTEGTNTSISRNKIQRAEICHVRRIQIISDLACPTHVHQLRMGYSRSWAPRICGLSANEN